jgi:hypothetical protein
VDGFLRMHDTPPASGRRKKGIREIPKVILDACWLMRGSADWGWVGLRQEESVWSSGFGTLEFQLAAQEENKG